MVGTPSSAIFTATIILLSTSIVGATAMSGLARFTWAGMAVFGWIYVIIAFGPWPGNGPVSSQLLMTAVLDDIEEYMVSDGKTPYFATDYRPEFQAVF
jgi:hypothetical protein